MLTPIIVELVQYAESGEKITTGETGVVVSEHLVPVPDQSSGTGMRFQAMLGVCWENNRSPAVSYHSPEELEWLSIPAVEDNDEDEAEDEDEAAEFDAPNTIGYIQPTE